MLYIRLLNALIHVEDKLRVKIKFARLFLFWQKMKQLSYLFIQKQIFVVRTY
jgi:hypothetical protein